MQGDVLIKNLLKPAAYAHPTQSLRLIETHSAWVVLTGEFAYKLKKPVNFGFLDFSTLQKRQFFCAEEVRLNRRLAPHLYLDVVAITGTVEQPQVDGRGAVLEYAVRMQQFADAGLLSQLAQQHRLQTSHIDQLVQITGNFHLVAEHAAADAAYGDPGHINHWVSENFQQLQPLLQCAEEIESLQHLQQWSEAEHQRLLAQLQQRQQGGFIRECHGDLHLGNLTLINGKVTPFDCIEFNAELRWIDVISEVAFLVMDLDDRGYGSFASRFLNGYLQLGGDYAGLAVLRYYQVYRAMVRAKVAILRRQQFEVGNENYRHATHEYHQYARLAGNYIESQPVALLITHGLSGSGKSTLASQLCEQAGMIQLRSDVERKRLAGLTANHRSHSATGAGLYTRQHTESTYAQLATLATTVLQAGYSVVVDASFLQQGYRQRFQQLALTLQVPFIILHCEAIDELLEQRIQSRERAGKDVSEASLEVLRSQQRIQEALDEHELSCTLSIDTRSLDIAWIRASVAVRVTHGLNSDNSPDRKGLAPTHDR